MHFDNIIFMEVRITYIFLLFIVENDSFGAFFYLNYNWVLNSLMPWCHCTNV